MQPRIRGVVHRAGLAGGGVERPLRPVAGGREDAGAALLLDLGERQRRTAALGLELSREQADAVPTLRLDAIGELWDLDLAGLVADDGAERDRLVARAVGSQRGALRFGR